MSYYYKFVDICRCVLFAITSIQWYYFYGGSDIFTDEEQFKIKYLCEEVPELSHIIRRYKEESQYILTSVSHELRNPITLIHSTVQLMERRNPSVAQIPYWSQLKDDINTTISLLNEYSDFNHSENVHWSTIDLYQLIHDVKCSFMTTCNDKDIKLMVQA